MRIGPTLLGGIVGAAVGVAVHVALAIGLFGKPIEAPWFAVITGLLTGLGVRQVNKAEAHSYLRGALSALLALGAIFATYPAIKQALAIKAESDAKQAKAAAAKTVDEAKEESEEAADAADAPETVAAADTQAAPREGGAAKVAGPEDFNPLQFASMMIGAFLAYAIGSGSGRPAPQPAPPHEEPVAMDPSN